MCALAYVEPGGREEIVHGRCEGTLAAEPRGDGGFGYDPAFVPDDYPATSRTMAELTPRRRTRSATAAAPPARSSCACSKPRRPSARATRSARCSAACGERRRGGARERDAPGARAEQRTATAASVAAAVFLVTVKLVTGLVTGSLAFIAEAAHSATDLVAALLTFFAVRVAVRPPDREHHYGHGKAEHLAALGESAFLMLVSLFIGYESIRRLAGGDEATTWM